MEQFWQVFWAAVGTVVTALASWLSVVLTTWLSSKIKDKKIAKIVTDITQIIFDAVAAVTQSFVDTLKKNGKFDEAAQAEAQERALKIINSQLTEPMIQYIKDNFGDVQEYLKNRIEAMLYSLKK